MQHHFTDSVTIARTTVTGYQSTYSNVATIFCHIQPITDRYGIGEMGRDGKDYRMYSYAEVKVGDRLTHTDTRKFEVTGAAKYSFRGKTHYQSTLRGV